MNRLPPPAFRPAVLPYLAYDAGEPPVADPTTRSAAMVRRRLARVLMSFGRFHPVAASPVEAARLHVSGLLQGATAETDDVRLAMFVAGWERQFVSPLYGRLHALGRRVYRSAAHGGVVVHFEKKRALIGAAAQPCVRRRLALAPAAFFVVVRLADHRPLDAERIATMLAAGKGTLAGVRDDSRLPDFVVSASPFAVEEPRAILDAARHEIRRHGGFEGELWAPWRKICHAAVWNLKQGGYRTVPAPERRLQDERSEHEAPREA